MSQTKSIVIFLVALVTTCCALPRTIYPSAIHLTTDATVSLAVVSEEGDIRPYCTGVYVAQDLILSARHCAVYAMSYSYPDGVMEALMELADTTGTQIRFNVQAEEKNLGENPTRLNKGVVISQDKDHDLVLIRVSGYNPPHRYVKVASTVEVGDSVIVVGGPKGLLFTYMPGTVAAIRPDIPGVNDGLGIHGPFIQVFSSIAPGCSGGGVFNTDGELIGIVSFTMRAPNQGFAIHLQSINKFLSAPKKE